MKDQGLQTREVGGITLDLIELGEGRPLLFLHGGEGPDVPTRAHLEVLAKHYRVIAPWHPGFGSRARAETVREVADLAYLYLDLAEQLGIQDGILVGASFGGWIAAEMMVRDRSAFSHLVLSGPVGIKVRDREARDIEDFFALTDEEFRDLAYADPTKGYRDLTALDDEKLTGHFRSLETYAFYSWKPYMHNPHLKRWLHRIRRPALIVSGRQDRFVFDGYYAAFAEALAGSSRATIENAGHFPHVEQPLEFADLVVAHTGPTQAVNERVA
ncbi:alpha/beta fold hydrolase [Rhizobium sp. CF142]|uniref:alpha/beta fold hydrolase n=1 Tax=Rhizobium sp. CF142 TaxID=1144314 RepID=UPI0006865A97|nr:alpha/beta hydrolase [Rhizobium sp. CF142]